MHTGILHIQSNAYMEMIDITTDIQNAVSLSQINNGLCLLYNPHTTSGLTINEGSDPDVCDDIITGLKHIVPMRLHYKHAEGNSPAHIMASLMG